MFINSAFVRILCACLMYSATFMALSVPAHAFTAGTIVPEGDYFAHEAHEAFMDRLKNLGLLNKIKFIHQSPKTDIVALKNTMRKFAAHHVDVIITYGAPATLSALGEEQDIPIIYGGVDRPIHNSIKNTNATGVCIKPPLSSITRYISHSTRENRVGILFCATEKDSSLQMLRLTRLCSKAGMKAVPVDLSVSSNISTALSDAEVGFFFITTSTCAQSAATPISRISENKKTPLASLQYIEGIEPVIAYYPEPADTGRLMAKKLKALIEGAEPREIKQTCSSKAELVFNIGKARELELKIPIELVTGATRVIY